MAKPELILRTEHYTEGVVTAADGTLYFSMTAPGQIVRTDVASGATEVWAHVAAANGHAIEDANTHVVLSSVGAILHLDRDGRTSEVVASKIGGEWLVYPNDVTLDPRRGGCYVTDSGYRAMPRSIAGEGEGRVYRIDGDGRGRAVANGIAYANGIALSHDGRTLYVGESLTHVIWAYAVADDGSLYDRRRFATTPPCESGPCVPDGITIGPQHALFVAHYGAREILVYATDGSLAERLPAGNKATSHATCSPDGTVLYVSGGIEDESGPGAIFAIPI